MTDYNFQYCQKIVVFSKNLESVLLCKRKSEEDYNDIYSFIGGKMENTDKSLLDSLKREKNEEVGNDFKIEIYPSFTLNILFRKRNGKFMILPHYYARHIKGEIELGEEYSGFQWVSLKKLDHFEPKISTVSKVVTEILQLRRIISSGNLIII